MVLILILLKVGIFGPQLSKKTEIRFTRWHQF